MLVRAALVLAFVPAALVTPRAAHACTCVRPMIERRTIPPDESANLPLDTQIRVIVTGGLPDAVRQGLRHEYRLRDARGALVPLDATVQFTMITLSPRAALAPRTRYTVERVFAYDEHGERLSDDRRWMLAQRAAHRDHAIGVQLRWFPESAFTTGDAGATTVPSVPKTIRARVALSKSTCGPGGLQLDYRATPRPTELLGVEIEGRGVVQTFAPVDVTHRIEGDQQLFVGDLACIPDRYHLVIGDTLAARVVVISARGDVAREPRFTAVELPDVVDLDRAGFTEPGPPSPDGREAASMFFGPASEPTMAEQLRLTGPPTCPHGLEPDARSSLHPGTLPWMDGGQTSLSQSGDIHTVFVDERTERAQLLSIADSGRRRRILLGRESSELVAAFGAQRFVTAATVYQTRRHGEQPSSILVVQRDYAGRELWRTGLDGTGTNWHPRIVRTDTDVLVAWQSQGRARYAVLDAISGRVRRRGEEAMKRRDGAIALAATGREPPFMMAWASAERDSVDWTFVRADGSRSALASVGGLDLADLADLALAPLDDDVVLAIAGRDLVVQTLASTRLLPTRIDLGVGARPRAVALAARSDRTLVAAWDTADRGFVAAFDLDGHVAPATPLGAGAAITIPAVRTEPDGTVLAVYGTGSIDAGTAPWLERFTCARAPRPIAPDRIDLTPATLAGRRAQDAHGEPDP